MTLVVRANQLRAFEDELLRPFFDDMVAELREGYTDAVAGLDDARLREEVAEGVRRARRYGIEERNQVRAFVILRLALSPSFDEHPRIAAILNDPALQPRERMPALLSRVGRRTWGEVQRAAGRAHAPSRLMSPQNGGTAPDEP